MFVLKLLARNSRIISAVSRVKLDQSRLVSNLTPLLSKNYSPESSPVKTVVKKKRRISSSSEEEVSPKKEDAAESPRFAMQQINSFAICKYQFLSCCSKGSSKPPERKSLKISPDASKKAKSKTTPKTTKVPAKKDSSEKSQTTPKSKFKKEKSPKPLSSEPSAEIKSESPENKPLNDQETSEDPKIDDSKTLKVQTAGAGQAGADYNPSKKKYHPIDDAFWKRGEK